MPRYYFSIKDSTSIEGDEGVELSNLDAAKSEATRYAGALISDDRGAIWERRGWHMNVSDERGVVLLRLHVAAVVLPAEP